MISTGRLQLIFFTVLTTAVTALTFFIFKPYIGPIFLAAILAIVFHPLYKKCLKVMKGRESSASLATVLIILMAILVPSVFFGIAIFKEAASFYDYIYTQGDKIAFLDVITGFIKKNLPGIIPNESIYVTKYLEKVVNWLFTHFDSFFSGFLRVLMGILIMTISIFFFLKDGSRIIKRLIAFSPLTDSYDEQIINKVETAITSVVKGSLIIALIKGILTAVGFMVFSVPNPILWGAVSALASMIPVVGSSLVIAPAVLYLYLGGFYASAIGFAVWGIILVGLSDNILNPLLIKRGVKIHPFLILLSVLGGLGFFGPIGFIAGPVVLSLLFALFEIYPLIIQKIVYEKSCN